MPSGLWRYEFIAQLLQGLYRNANKLPSRHTRMPRSWGFFVKNLLVGDWPILCGRKQGFQGPPRTSQHIPARRSSTAKILFEDPKCHSRRSWSRDPENSKSKPIVQARAPSRWGAQSGRRQRPRQLDNVELDSSYKAVAACQVRASSKPTSERPNARHVSSKTAFLV